MLDNNSLNWKLQQKFSDHNDERLQSYFQHQAHTYTHYSSSMVSCWPIILVSETTFKSVWNKLKRKESPPSPSIPTLLCLLPWKIMGRQNVRSFIIGSRSNFQQGLWALEVVLGQLLILQEELHRSSRVGSKTVV